MTDQEAAVILRLWVEAFETDGLYRTAEAVQRGVDALERESKPPYDVKASGGQTGPNTFMPQGW